MLEAGLESLLRADTTFAALVGTRIYPVQGPPSNPTYPYVVYQNAPSPATAYTFEGRRLQDKTIQFDVYARTYKEGKVIFAAIEGVLSGFSGLLPDGTRVLFATQVNEMDNFDKDQRSYRSVCEYQIQYS